MTAQETVQKFVDAFSAKDYDTCVGYLSDDFQFSGPVPQPQSAQQWMGTVKGMNAAMPDINYNLQVTGTHDDHIHLQTQLTGTHTAEWDLSPLGIGVVPATNKAFSNPAEQGTMTVQDGKITGYEIASSEAGGLMGILAQLGIEMPG